MEFPSLVLLIEVCFFHWTTAAPFESGGNRLEIDNGLLKKVTPLTKTKAIVISGMNIKSIANDAFHGLTKIESLDLSNNIIEKLEGSTFHSLPDLKELSLAHNDLKSVDFDTSTPVFAGLGHLKRLDLSGNNMSELSSDSFIGLPSSAEVIIDPFSVHYIPRTFYFREHSSPREKLNFSNRAIPKTGSSNHYRIKLCETNGTVESLSKLKMNEILDRNCIEVFEHRYPGDSINLRKRHLKKFNRNWYQLPDAKNIDLTGNLITDIAPELLNDLPMPLTIHLSVNKIRIIKKNIIENKQCMKLWLGGKFLEAIEDDAFKNLCLTTLKISGSALKNLDFIRTLPVMIRSLKLFHNKISEIPSNLFRNLHQLSLVDWEDNRIKTIRENAFSGLGNSSHVRLLLTDNRINSIEAGSFSHARIDYLDLELNDITDESIRKGAFKESVVQEINLSRNKMKSFDEELFSGLEGDCIINYEYNLISRIKNLNYRTKTI